MPDRAVYKSVPAEFLDDLFSGEAEPLDSAYDFAVDLLVRTRTASLSQAAARLADDGKLPANVGTVEHFEAHWLSDRGPMAGKNVDRVMRYGYQQAIRMAQSGAKPVPIETLWVTGAGEEFEVHICQGKRQVTVVMFIPLPESGSDRARSRSWVVRVADPGDADDAEHLDDADPPIVMVQVSGPPPAAP